MSFRNRDEYEAWKAARAGGTGQETGSASAGESLPSILPTNIAQNQEPQHELPAQRRMALLLSAITPLAALGVVFAINYVQLQSNMSNVLASDPRNHGIEVLVHYRTYVDSSVLVYDLRSVSGDKSLLDVLRVFFQFSSSVHGHSFKEVWLEFRGREKFRLPGQDFKTLGEEFGTQNPVYTVRTLPEKLLLPDGKRAFGTWTGGLLGVTSKQMEDVNEFGRRWFLEDFLRYRVGS